MGGDVRRAGDSDGTFAGRSGLPAEHALRPLHQRAGIDADVPPVRRRANRRDAESAAPEAGRRKANHPQRAGHGGIEGVRAIARRACREIENRPG